MPINMKNVASGGTRTAIPTGRYNVKIEKAELKESAAGNQMVSMQMSVNDGPQKGRYCFDQLVLIDSNFWKLKLVLDCLESPLAESDSLEEAEIPGEIVGGILSAYLEESKDSQGNPQNKVSGYQKATSAKPKLFG